jgi:hypothetical protein
MALLYSIFCNQRVAGAQRYPIDIPPAFSGDTLGAFPSKAWHPFQKAFIFRN